MSNPMIELFQTELTGYLQQLGDSRDTEALHQLSESVQGAAMLVGLEALVELSGAMVNVNDPDAIENWISLLREMTANDPETIMVSANDMLEHLTSDQKVQGFKQEMHLTTDQKVPENDSEPVEDHDILTLFRIELETHTKALSDGILQLEHQPDMPCESLMRAAHSIKGAARIAGKDDLVHLAHAIEDFFTLVIEKKHAFNPDETDILLQAIDAFQKPDEMAAYTEAIRQMATVNASHVPSQTPAKSTAQVMEKEDTEVRVTTEKLNRLLNAAGQAVVEARQGEGIGNMILTLKSHFTRLGSMIGELERKHLLSSELRKRCHDSMHTTGRDINRLLAAFDQHYNEISVHTETIYDELVGIRMRPFEDGLAGFPRMVRQVARSLNKKVRFYIEGRRTEVDRDILQLLEAPLTHLVRNAIDHGLETPEQRTKSGKDKVGIITVAASHQSGKLRIEIRDDGRGIDIESIKEKAIAKSLISQELMDGLSEREIYDFMFLPGFSTREEVTETSGRGVGMDVVQTMIQKVGGDIAVSSQPGAGTTFTMLLPLTLSIVRVLLAKINDTIFAFPLSRIVQIAHPDEATGEFSMRTISAAEVLLREEPSTDNPGPAIVLQLTEEQVGLTVDELIIERDVVVTPLDKRLGKVQNIDSTTTTRFGEAAFVVDMDDLVQTITGLKIRAHRKAQHGEKTEQKRILVVEDSITVREMEKRVLEKAGFIVETAVDGMDGWNTLRSGTFDLVVSDIDMPRMNGFELVELIRRDPIRSWLPVVILSYKDRDEDRQHALQSGADRFLNKGAFEDDAFIEMIKKLLYGVK